MKNLKFLIILIIIPTLVLADTKNTSVKKEMQNAYKHFVNLQEFLISEEKFKSKENKINIASSINGLHEAFQSVQILEANKKNYSLGFLESADALSQMLHDTKTLYKNEFYRQAFLQLKNVSNNCISCHASFKTAIKYNVSGKTEADKAEFYLATRQLSKAKDAFHKKAINSNESQERIQALKRWILIYTRIESNPKPIAKVLKKLQKIKNLSAFEKEMLAGWLDSVIEWQKDKPSKSALDQAESLIERASEKEDFIYESVGTIELLRASALLHRVLGKKDLKLHEQRRALYMLGYTYLKVPGYLINEASDIYLIQCIKKFPASEEAKKSYKLYQILTRNRYEQKGYSKLPGEILAKLKDLHDIAYGMPSWRL